MLLILVSAILAAFIVLSIIAVCVEMRHASRIARQARARRRADYIARTLYREARTAYAYRALRRSALLRGDY